MITGRIVSPSYEWTYFRAVYKVNATQVAFGTWLCSFVKP